MDILLIDASMGARLRFEIEEKYMIVKKRCMPVLLGLVLLGAASCTTIKVASNKESGYDRVLQRVAIIGEASDLKIEVSATTAKRLGNKDANFFWDRDVDLGLYLADCVATRLKALDAEARVFYRSGLELNDEQLQQQIRDFSASHTLVLKLTDGTVNSKRKLVSGNFEAALIDQAFNRTVWKAVLRIKVRSGTQYEVSSDELGRLAEQLVSAFQNDGLVLSLVPVK